MRLSNLVCLKLIRRGLSEVLAPEIQSEVGDNTVQVLIRTVDELLMRDQAAQSGLVEAMAKATAKCAELLQHAQHIGVAKQAHHERFEALNDHVEAWRSAPQFTDVQREMLELSEELVELTLNRSDSAPDAAELELVNTATGLEAGLEKFVFDAAVREQPSVEEEAGHTEEDIRDFLRRSCGEPDLVIKDFESIPGGMSKRTYRFTASSPQWGEQPLIARETAGVPHADFDCWVLANEFQLVRTLHGLGMPVPDPLYLHEDGGLYVMRRSEGSRNSNVFSVTTEMPRPVLLAMAEALAKLHTTTPDQLLDYVKVSGSDIVLGETVEQCVRRTLLRWRDYSRRMRRLPAPGEYQAFSWLLHNIPNNEERPSMLHGDFGPHNSLWDGDRLTAVLDWEGGHFGDPAFDLGYVRPHIEGRMDWDEFLNHYYLSGGPRVDARRLDYCERFSMYRTLVTTNQAVSRADYGEKSDLFMLQVDWEYWCQFIQQSAAMQAADS